MNIEPHITHTTNRPAVPLRSNWLRIAAPLNTARQRVRGMAVVIVLGLLAITLALSYAMMRSNFTNSQIQTNFLRRGDSRQAAYAGLSFGLRKIQQSSWGGVNSSVTQDLGGGQSFTVTYSTGDAWLGSGDSRFAYRVTITSQGTATDLSNSTITSSFTVAAVVQLIPRKFVDEPTRWSSLQPYTVYQWGDDWWMPLIIDVPLRIEGGLYCQNAIYLAPFYPGDGDDVPFAGQIDEVAIFGKALTSQQMADLNSGVISVQSLTGNSTLSPISHWRLNEAAGSLVATDELHHFNGLYDGGKSGGSAGPNQGGSGSVVLDGYNDHVNLGKVVAPGSALTILAWIKPTVLDADNGRIISKTTSADDDSYYWMLSTYKNSTNYRLRFRLRANGVVDTLIASSGNLSVNQWTFVGATYDGSKMRLYKDGVLVGSDDKTGSISSGSSVLVSLGNNPPASPRARLLRDWTSIKTLTGVDNRPLTGPITAPQSLTSAKERSLFTDELQLTWNNVASVTETPLTHPGQVLTYQLYPGGKTYDVTNLGATLRDAVIQPDYVNNPLGVCYRNGSLSIENNVTFTGVLIVNGTSPDVEIDGTNIKLQAVSVPTLDGSTAVTQLPVAMILDDCTIHGGSTGTINGVVSTWDKFGFVGGAQNAEFTVNGKIITNEFYVLARTEWDNSNTWWKDRATEFLGQLAGASPVPFFPTWLQSNYSLDPVPHVRVRPDSTSPVYRWHNWTQPLFVAHPSDGGLRWEVVQIREIR